MVHNKKNWSIVSGVVLVMLLILITSTAWAGTCDPDNPTEEDCECRQKVLVDNEWKYRVVPLENCLERKGDDGDNDSSWDGDDGDNDSSGAGSGGSNGGNGGSGNGSKPSGSKGNASANNGKGGNYDRTGHSDNGRGNGRNR